MLLTAKVPPLLSSIKVEIVGDGASIASPNKVENGVSIVGDTVHVLFLEESGTQHDSQGSWRRGVLNGGIQ